MIFALTVLKVFRSPRQEEVQSLMSRRVVELRIHGVGGAPASDTLDDPYPGLVVGDEISGFWQPRENEPNAVKQREAMAWGGNTSGSWRHALWVLLLPFALVNVAGWMHQPSKAPPSRVRLFGVALTLSVTLLVTVAAFDVVAIQCGRQAACVAGQAWLRPFEWTAVGAGQGTPVGIFSDHPERRLALTTLLPLTLLMLLWFAGRYSYQDLEQYDPWPHIPPSAPDGVDLRDGDFWRGAEPVFRARMLHAAAGRLVIAGTLAWSVARIADGGPRFDFFSGATTVRFFWITVACAALLALVGVLAARSETYHRGPNSLLRASLAAVDIASWAALSTALAMAANVGRGNWNLVAVVAVVAIVVTGWLVWRSRELPATGGTPPSQTVLRVGGLVSGMALGLALATGAAIAEPPLGTPHAFHAGLFKAPYEVVGLLAGIHIALLLSMLTSKTTRTARPGREGVDDGRSPLGGLGAPVLCLISLFLTVSVGAGIHLRATDLFGEAGRCWDREVEDCPPAEPDNAPVQVESEGVAQTAIATPWWYETTALVSLVGLVALGIAGWRYSRALGHEPGKTSKERYDSLIAHLTSDPSLLNVIPDPAQNKDVRRRLDDILRMQRLGPTLLRADRLLAGVVITVLGISIVLYAIQDPASPWADQCWRPLGRDVCPFGRSAGAVATFALWLVSLIPLVAIAALRYLTSSRGLRRQFGRLWDVLTFWPRHVHPFAPPAYAERVVPQLRLHINNARKHGRGVVVAGHSQGSILAASSLAMDEPGAPATEAYETATVPLPELVTHGSPIGILYERYFPSYFGPQLFDRVADRVGHWHNVYALTDVCAYQTFSADPGSARRGCRVCGYHPQAPIDPTVACGDFEVVDPELWDDIYDEPPPPRPHGHSTYHIGRHTGFEAHLDYIANRVAQEIAERAPAGDP